MIETRCKPFVIFCLGSVRIFGGIFLAISVSAPFARASSNPSALPQVEVTGGSKTLTFISRPECQHSFEKRPPDSENNQFRHWGEILYIEIDRSQNVLISSCPRSTSSTSTLTCQNIISKKSVKDLCESEERSIIARQIAAKLAVNVGLKGLGLPALILGGFDLATSAIEAGTSAFKSVRDGHNKDSRPRSPNCPVVRSLIKSLSETNVQHETRVEGSSKDCVVTDLTNVLVNTTTPQAIQNVTNSPPVTITQAAQEEGGAERYIVTVTRPAAAGSSPLRSEGQGVR